MSHQLRIDFVATPFAGHLHPQLDLAMRLNSAADFGLHFLSTSAARRAIELCGFSMTELLSNRTETISGIANAPRQVGSNPLRLLAQLRDNVSMMDQLLIELRQRWEHHPPDLVIVDFAVPIAGLLAQSMGIRWWTSFTALCAMETPDGVPTYLGGLRPMPGILGRVRDVLGRSFVRSFKRSVHFAFRRDFRRIGIPSIYQPDHYETIYSRQKILALRPQEFEFPRSWPDWLVFVGPLTDGPEYAHEPPEFVEGKPHVLISLGTHVPWAKQAAAQLMRQVAEAMPDVVFHFSHGAAAGKECNKIENFHSYSYLPYDKYAQRYAASINHTGSGVMFSCLRNGVPILAWPQDFDQFDHTARIVHQALGLRCRPKLEHMVQDLRRLLTDTGIRANVNKMQETIAGYDTTGIVMRQIEIAFGGL